MLNEGPTLPDSSIFLSIERCCRVTVRGYKEIRSSAQVFQYGPPKILPSSDSVVTAKIASDAVLTCDSFAIPLPAKVL